MPGKPEHVPDERTRKTVAAMVGYGIPQDEIAAVIGIDPKTLRKHYREEIDTAATRANAKVAESLYNKATGDGSQAVTAAIWWTKARMGWKGTDALEHSGPDGGPIQTEDTGARDKLADLLARKSAGSGAGGDTGGAE